MRLTCPRCGAQYEIDGSQIPAAGRVVECSACGENWRQAPEAEAGPLRLVPAPPVGTFPNAGAAGGQGDGEDVPQPFDATDRPPLNRPLSESILSILREEAGREISARRRDLGAGEELQDGTGGEDAAADDDPDYSPPPLPAPGADPATDAATRILPRSGPDLFGDEDDALWPATTLTHPTPDRPDVIPADRPGAEDPIGHPAIDARRNDAVALPRLTDNDATADDVLLHDHETLAGDHSGHHERDTGRNDPQSDLLDRDDPAPVVPGIAAAHAIGEGAFQDQPTFNDPPNQHPAPLAPAPARTAAIPYAVPPEARARRRGDRRGAYDSGFALALMVALLALALYALAPRMADQGAFGATLMDLRKQADEGRAWLQSRADGLIDGLRR